MVQIVYTHDCEPDTRPCKVGGCGRMALNNGKLCYLHAENPDRRKRGVKTNIYFAIGVGTDLVKIGQAKDVNARLSSIQTCSPVRIVLACTIFGPSMMEYQIHEYLCDERERGEWFRLEDKTIQVIEAATDRGVEGVLSILRAWDMRDKGIFNKLGMLEDY